MTAPTGTGWRRVDGGRPFSVRAVATAPFAYGYLVVLLATTLVLWTVPSQVADRLLAASSTDVAHLAHDPVSVLLASAFWLPGRSSLPYAVVLVLVLAPMERRFGVRRTVQVFLSGHVLATLLTELPIAAAISMHLLAPSEAHRLDVGVSYGTYAAVSAIAGALSRRSTVLVIALALVSIVAPSLTDPDMTTYGHLLSLGIGMCWWPVLYGRPSREPTSGQRDVMRSGCQGDQDA